MAKHPIAELPEGYIIAILHERHFPLKITTDAHGVPHAHGFKYKKEDQAVSYSKRMYAAHFIEQHHAGTLDWAEVTD